MTTFYLALTLTGGLLLLLGVTSGLIKRDLYVSEPLVALFVGVLIGPAVLGLLRVAEWGDPVVIVREAARVTLAISLIGLALRLPKRYLTEHWRPLLVVYGVIMPLMWLSSSLLVYLILPLGPLVALLIARGAHPDRPGGRLVYRLRKAGRGQHPHSLAEPALYRVRAERRARAAAGYIAHLAAESRPWRRPTSVAR